MFLSVNGRYIPARQATNMEASYHLLHSSVVNCSMNNLLSQKENGNENENLVDSIKRKLIIDTCNGLQEKSKVLHLHNKLPDHEQSFNDNIKILYSSNSNNAVKNRVSRYIPQSPDRILDAPDFRDDYCEYLSFCIVRIQKKISRFFYLLHRRSISKSFITKILDEYVHLI